MSAGTALRGLAVAAAAAGHGRYRVEERHLLADGAYRHVWHEDHNDLDRALNVHRRIVAYASAMRLSTYAPDGPRRLVVREVTR